MPAAYTAFVLMQFWYLWTPIEGAARTWKYDPQHAYWGDLALYANTLLDGQLALWNPFDRGGYPLYGDPQPGLLYPPNWPLFVWGMLTGGADYALVEVKVIAHWIFGAVGMHLFARRRGAVEPACYVGGTLFSFTSPTLRYGGSTLNWTFAWIPWILWATDRFAERPDLRRAIVLGSFVAMSLLAGAPAGFLFMLIVAIPFGIHLLWGRLRGSAGMIGVAALVSLLWLLPLVLSNLEQVPASVRATRDLTFITGTPFRLAHLMNLLIPKLGGENIYIGLAPLVGLGIAAGTQRLGTVRLFLAIAALGLLFALGKNTELLASVASLLPPFTLFRWAHRYLYVTNVALAAGAALGISYLCTLDDPERLRALARAATRVCLLITAILGIAWAVSVGAADKLFTGKNDALGLALISAVLGTWLVRAVCVSPRRQAYAWALAAFVAVDIWVANGHAHAEGPGLSPKPGDTTARDLMALELDGVRDLRYRIFDRDLIRFRAGTRLGVRDLGGYEDDPLGLSRYRAFLEMVSRNPATMGHANVRYYFHGARRPQLRIARRREFQPLQNNVYELREVAPAVMYVARPERVHSEEQAFAALSKITPGTGAVVEGEVALGPEGTAPAGTAAQGGPIVSGTMTVFEPNRVVAEIETPGPGLVVVAEAYYPAWTAEVDGEPAPILVANGMFRGVSVAGAGRHRIEMRLRPLRFWATLPGYLGACGLLLWTLWPRRRRARADEPVSGAAADEREPPASNGDPGAASRERRAPSGDP